MDAHTPQPSVRLVRGYTKRPPPLEIPTLESIRARGTSSSTSSSTAPSPSSASTLVPLRAEKRSVWRKMNDVLRTYGFDSLGEFLSVLFHPRVRGEKDSRSKHHRQAVGAFLQGRSKITMAHIMPLIYNHRKSRPKRSDTEQSSLAFSPYNHSQKFGMHALVYRRGQRGSLVTTSTTESANLRAKTKRLLEAVVISERQIMAVLTTRTFANGRMWSFLLNSSGM